MLSTMKWLCVVGLVALAAGQVRAQEGSLSTATVDWTLGDGLAVGVEEHPRLDPTMLHSMAIGDLSLLPPSTYTLFAIYDLDAMWPQPPRVSPINASELYLIRILDPHFTLAVRLQDLDRVQRCLEPWQLR